MGISTNSVVVLLGLSVVVVVVLGFSVVVVVVVEEEVVGTAVVEGLAVVVVLILSSGTMGSSTSLSAAKGRGGGSGVGLFLLPRLLFPLPYKNPAAGSVITSFGFLFLLFLGRFLPAIGCGARTEGEGAGDWGVTEWVFWGCPSAVLLPLECVRLNVIRRRCFIFMRLLCSLWLDSLTITSMALAC